MDSHHQARRAKRIGSTTNHLGPSCSFQGCGRTAVSKTLCDTHYHQKRSGKELQAIGRHGGRDHQPVEPRFFSKISKESRHPDHGECWIWVGSIHRKSGYGQFYMHGRPHRAHRASYLHFVGPIPAKEHVHHKCSQRACVNPDHLQLSTQRENNAEMFARRAYLAKIAELERENKRLVRRNNTLRRALDRFKPS